jgi:hypothetical protein
MSKTGISITNVAMSAANRSGNATKCNYNLKSSELKSESNCTLNHNVDLNSI